jgi:urease accessory protein
MTQPLGATERAWRARLELGFEAQQGRSYLARRRHEGPLVVQRPFFPEGNDVPHVYLLHPPGGLVTGDDLGLDVQVGAGAHALITTPAAGKAYRGLPDAGAATQAQRLTVAAGGALEWMPQETIVFSGAEVTFVTDVQLDAQATFVGWEVLCLGRPAAGELFTRGRCQQRWTVRAGGSLLYLERANYEGGAPLLHAAWGLAGAPTTGTMLAYPVNDAMVEPLREVCARNPDQLAVTRLDGDLLVARYLGPSGERARACFRELWSVLRPLLLQRPAVAPRIWAT